MARVNVPTMKDYAPVELNGNFTATVRDVKESANGNGYTILMDIIDGPDDQEWAGEGAMFWFSTDIEGADEAWQKKQRKTDLYRVGQAFNVNPDDFDTDDLIGKTTGITLKTKTKDGVSDTRVVKFFAAV